jgi:hypothetical protein
LLIYINAKASALQQSSDRQAGQSGAQNGNPRAAIHPLTSSKASHAEPAYRSPSNECA